MALRRIGLGSAAVVAVAVALFGACQTPTSMTVSVSTDVDCGPLEDREAVVVAGDPDEILGRLEPSSTKVCTDDGPVGDVVLLPLDDEQAAVGFKVILGVDRPTSECGAGGETEAEAWKGCIIARRRLAFIEGSALVVEVPLRTDCIGVPCSEANFETCVAGGKCVPADLDPADCADADGCGEGELPPTVTSASASTGAGGGGGEGGGGAACSDPRTDCPPDSACGVAACVDGVCGEIARPAGDRCGDGRVCDGALTCVACVVDEHCAARECQVGSCDDLACAYVAAEDGLPCSTGLCEDGACVTPEHCFNRLVDEGESDVDCGGDCPGCDVGEDCVDGGDCASGFCDAGTCALCTGPTDCPADQHCDAGTCVPDSGSPGDCANDDECLSGFCEGGTCCETACEGACRTCGTGTCMALSGQQAGCRVDACANGCDAGECDYAPAGTACGASCTDATLTTFACDGAGACNDPTTISCGLYACSGDACGTTCDAPEDCNGATCLAGFCQPTGCTDVAQCMPSTAPCRVAACLNDDCTTEPANDGDGCGNTCSPDASTAYAGICQSGLCERTPTNCCPYVCVGGACLTQCDGPEDCAPGIACVNRQCGGGGGLGASGCQGADQ